MSAKKLGRPTDDPKPVRISVRINLDDARILEEYCKRTGKPKPDAIRDAIRALEKL